MALQFNKYILQMKPSASMETMAKAKKLKAQDPEIIDLAGGEPDFDTPKKICDELFRQINAGFTHYTVGPGLPELRQRIADKLERENGCHYDPSGVVVTPGGKYAIYIAVRALVNAGDEVMYLTPGWVSYPSHHPGIRRPFPVEVDLAYEDRYRITLELLEEKVSARPGCSLSTTPTTPLAGCLPRKRPRCCANSCSITPTWCCSPTRCTSASSLTARKT